MKRRGKLLIVGAGVTAVAGAAIAIVLFINHQQTARTQTIKSGQHLTFHAVTPASAPLSKLDNTSVMNTPNSGQVLTYTDSLDSIAITINQQKFPSGYKLADIAKNLNANDKISGAIPLYIGTSEQGPQTAVLSKNGLLILIKSSAIIKDSSWERYAVSLN